MKSHFENPEMESESYSSYLSRDGRPLPPTLWQLAIQLGTEKRVPAVQQRI